VKYGLSRRNNYLRLKFDEQRVLLVSVSECIRIKNVDECHYSSRLSDLLYDSVVTHDSQSPSLSIDKDTPHICHLSSL